MCLQIRKISQADINTEIIFSCQMGRGNTTAGMVIATLLYFKRPGASGTSSASVFFFFETVMKQYRLAK